VGELLVILGTIKISFFYALLAALILVLGATYTLWMSKRVIWGPIKSEAVSALRDINRVEKMVLFSLAILVLGLGLWPKPLLDTMNASVMHLYEQMGASKLMP